MPRFRTWSFVALTATTLGLAGCSSSSASPSTTPTTSTTAAPVPTIPVQGPSPAGTVGTKPTVTVPPGTPPTQLESTDLIVGTGPAAKTGDHLTAQYVLATYSTGKEIQASWGGPPFAFVLDQNQVIPGWVAGIVGMKAGGRRELVIPPSLGYGASVPPGSSGISANDTLVFVVDLVKIG
jgi:peptidylprolyl isomerase